VGWAGAPTGSVARTPLASPDVLGISQGASACAVTIIVLGSGTMGAVSLPVAALIGSTLAAVVIWLLGSRRGMDTFRLVLSGIMITALLQSYITWLLLRADISDAAIAKTWLTGSLVASSANRNLPVLLVLALIVPTIGYMAFQLRAMTLGDDMAAGLGVSVDKHKALFLLVSVVLTAVAVSAAGPDWVCGVCGAPAGDAPYGNPHAAAGWFGTLRRSIIGRGGPGGPGGAAGGIACGPGHVGDRRGIPGVPSHPNKPKEHSMSRLAATGLRVGYGPKTIIDSLDVAIPDTQVTTIIGPNGCGKSTLLRAMANLLPTQAGEVTLDGTPIRALRRRDLARSLGVLPQTPVAPDGLIVSDLVARGRHPHQAWYRQWSSDDRDEVMTALRMTKVDDLADRTVDSLSGGQRQRVWISLVLAQQTDILFLDEPTTYLDLSHSIEVLELVHRLSREYGRTIVMVLHDLNLALRYSDNLVVMRDGSLKAVGKPQDVISPELLKQVFDLDAVVVECPVTGGPLIVPA